MLLAELQPGQRFRVIQVAFGGEIGKRLADLGFIAGVEGKVVRSAFFRGPMQVRLQDYDLIMRRHEAKLVQVELISIPEPEATEPQSQSSVPARKPILDLRPATFIRRLGKHGINPGRGGRHGHCR